MSRKAGHGWATVLTDRGTDVLVGRIPPAGHATRLGPQGLQRGHPAEVAASLLLGLEGLADEDEVLLGFPDSCGSRPTASRGCWHGCAPALRLARALTPDRASSVPTS